ncbi:MAG TPA: hypothetical protein VLY87_01115 [Flavobacterium sp.]|nr:hypothetical protein [Flavobacterium sp.]
MFTEENNNYWRNFSQLINADFKERKFWYSAQATFNYKGYDMIFDHYTHHAISGRGSVESFVTRVYCKFKCNMKLQLKMEEATFTNKFLNIFNFNKLQTDYPDLNSRFIITSTKESLFKIMNLSIVEKIKDSNVKQLYIGSHDGIWGQTLDKNHYELATYIDRYYVKEGELLKIKTLFEALIDELIKKCYIEPLN